MVDLETFVVDHFEAVVVIVGGALGAAGAKIRYMMKSESEHKMTNKRLKLLEESAEEGKKEHKDMYGVMTDTKEKLAKLDGKVDTILKFLTEGKK